MAETFVLPNRSLGEVLFASRRLDLIFLDPSFWRSPCLLPTPRGASWHWRVNLTFFSWVNGLAPSLAGDPEAEVRIAFVRSCVCAEYGITDDNWQDRMPAAGAELDRSFPLSTLGLIDFDLAQPWPGIEQAARAAGYTDPLPFRILGRDAHDAWIAAQVRASRLGDDDEDDEPVPAAAESKPTRRKRK